MALPHVFRDSSDVAVKCSGITKAGNRCNSPRVAGSAFCLMHSPDMTEVRREAGRKGGKNRAYAERAKKLLPNPLTSDDLAAWLSALFMSTMSGTLDPKIASACSAVARTIVDLEAQTAKAVSMPLNVDETRVAQLVADLAVAKVLLTEKEKEIGRLRDELTVVRVQMTECAKGI